MVCSIRLGVASIYSRARGPTGRTVSSSGAMLQAAIGMGEGRGGAVFPGDAQRHGFEAWGGAAWSGTCDALRGRGGVFDGERWLCGMGRRTGMSGGLLGRW